jgi:SM-20-related protein
MPSPEFFKTAGLFLKEGFLSNQQCDAIRDEMAAGQQADAALSRQGEGDGVVDPHVRKTKLARVSKETRLQMREALLSLLPALGEHFKVALTEVQPTNYLVYREGDFIIRHLDASKGGDRVESRRKVSIVVFLNDQSETPCDGAYAGGSLVFYGLLPPPFHILGHPLDGKRGSLVAFLPEVPHEVKPVTRGIRYTVVSWCE